MNNTEIVTMRKSGRKVFFTKYRSYSFLPISLNLINLTSELSFIFFL